MRTAAVSILFAWAVCLNLGALDNDVENALSKKYEKTVLILRHPVAGRLQRYNAAGELLKGGSESPWTVDGAIEVTKVRLAAGRLSIEGKRRFYGFDLQRNRLLPFKVRDREKPKVRLEIALDTAVGSLEEGDAIIHRIFTSNEEELIGSVPDFWRPFLIKQYGKSAADNQTPGNSTSSPPPTPTGNSEPQPAKVDNKTVKRPEPIFTPEPSFTDAARDFKFQGTMLLDVIIDKNGNVQRTRIVRPLGLGLDESGVAAVRTWRFRPATRDGEPVAVEMAIEISFHLF